MMSYYPGADECRCAHCGAPCGEEVVCVRCHCCICDGCVFREIAEGPRVVMADGGRQVEIQEVEMNCIADFVLRVKNLRAIREAGDLE